MNPTISPAALDAVLVTDGEIFFLSAAELVATMANLGHAQIAHEKRSELRSQGGAVYAMTRDQFEAMFGIAAACGMEKP